MESSALDAALEGAAATGGAQGTAAATGADGAGAIDGPTSIQTDADIAGALEAGRLSPAEAQQALIEQAVESQMPEGASPAERELIRAELEAVLAGDPTLAALLGE